MEQKVLLEAIKERKLWRIIIVQVIQEEKETEITCKGIWVEARIHKLF